MVIRTAFRCQSKATVLPASRLAGYSGPSLFESDRQNRLRIKFNTLAALLTATGSRSATPSVAPEIWAARQPLPLRLRNQVDNPTTASLLVRTRANTAFQLLEDTAVFYRSLVGAGHT